MTITETTPAPTIDFGPLLDLRARYQERADDLIRGVIAREPNAIAEARALLAEEERLGREVSAAVEPLIGSDVEWTRNDASDGIGEVCYSIRATGDLTALIEDVVAEHRLEVVRGIVDRVAENLDDELRAHETALGPFDGELMRAAFTRFAEETLRDFQPVPSGLTVETAR